jgi:DNA repair ATPase RecN
MTQLTSVSIDAFKRISNIVVALKGNLITISGNNAQGKSSFLDGIACTLGGSKLVPDNPINGDAKTGEITITTDDGMEITRRFWYDKKDNLKSDIKIVTADGGSPTSPQGLLNKLTSALSFDPLSFAKMDNRTRLKTLCDVYGVDVSGLNEMRKKKEDDRRQIGRDVRAREGQLKGLPIPVAGASAEPVDTEALLAEMQVLEAGERFRENCLREIQTITNRIADLESQLSQAKEDLDNTQSDMDRIPSKAAELDAVKAKLAGAQEANERASALAQRQQIVSEHRQLQSQYEQLSDDIADIDKSKQAQLEEMTGAIPGLGVDSDGVVTYQGLTFDEASTAEKLEVSTRMAIAMQPEEGIRLMLIRAGNDLDSKMLDRLGEIATENDVQILLERIVADGEITIEIEDGQLKG